MIRGVAPRTEPAVVERIATIASGNPLVLNLLLDLDVIRRDVAADGRIDTDPATLQRLPSTVRAIYQDLWEQLTAAERRVLALLAIQGPEFLPGFVEEAAIRLGLREELLPAFAAVRDVRGWIRPVNDDRFEFAERQRFEIADDVVHESFDAAQQATIESAIIDHVVALKASERWPELDLRTRRVALESHLDCNERLGEGVPRDLAAIADSMAQLAELDLDAGDLAKASELDAGSRALLEGEPEESAGALGATTVIAVTDAPAGPVWPPRPVPDLTTLAPSEVGALIVEVVEAEGSVEAARVYRLLTAASGSARLGRRIRAALDSGVRSAVRRGTIIASAPNARGASDRRLLRAVSQAGSGSSAVGQPDAPVLADEWGRHPWRGWPSHPVPALPDLSPRQVADLIVEVVGAEGPVTVGRVTEALRLASGATRLSKSITEAMDSGIGSGQRRGDIVVVSGRRGDPGSRVLRSTTQPEVALRTVGDRDPSSIPAAEIAELARRVAVKEPRSIATASSAAWACSSVPAATPLSSTSSSRRRSRTTEQGELRCHDQTSARRVRRCAHRTRGSAHRADWTFDAGPPVAAIGSATGWVRPAAPPPPSFDISFWTAIKFGAGFVIGAGLVSIAIWVILALLVLIGLNLPAAPLR